LADTLKAPAQVDRAPSLARYNASRIGFAAGVVAAALMLVAIVVLRVLSGVTSLPEVVAEGLLINMPGALFSAVLDSLQHAAKPLFYLAVGIGILIVGGLLGRLYATEPTWRQIAKIVVGVWLVIGLGVYTLLGAGIFGQHLQAGPIWHGGSLLVVVGVFGVALFETYTLLARRALRRHVRRGDVRDSPWPGDAWRRRVWGGRRARCGRHVRCRSRVRCGSRASCGRASRFSSLFPWLRGCGCRQRSRSDKECRDADVPLEHDTDLLSIAPGVNAGVACGFRLRTGRGLHAAYMACDKLDDQLFRIARVKNLEN